MGRTNPTYRDELRRFRERWAPFRRALRQPYQAPFDALLEGGERFADAAGFQAPMDAERGVLVSMLLAHEVDRRALEDRVAALEGQVAALAGRVVTLEGQDGGRADGSPDAPDDGAGTR